MDCYSCGVTRKLHAKQHVISCKPEANYRGLGNQDSTILVLGSLFLQVNKKFRKFGRKYRDCIKRNGDKIGTQTCYDIST